MRMFLAKKEKYAYIYGIRMGGYDMSTSQIGPSRIAVIDCMSPKLRDCLVSNLRTRTQPSVLLGWEQTIL